MGLSNLDPSNKDHYLSPDGTHKLTKSKNITREDQLEKLLDLKYNEAGKAVEVDKEVDRKENYIVLDRPKLRVFSQIQSV